MKYLVIGFLFGAFGLPLLSGINEYLMSVIELLKAKVAVKIVECNQRIEGSSNQPNRIGFAIPEEVSETD